MTKSEKPIIAVTGSSGLIGTKVLKAFCSNFEVVGLDLKYPEKNVPGTDFIECDLTEDESVVRALDKVRDKHGELLASVIHLAAYYDFSGEPSDMYRKLTVEGTFRLLKKLREFQTEQFVFSSSLLVMEPAEEDEKITEFSPLEDEPWDYPRSKIEAEQLIRQERGQIPTVILRIAGVYDEDCHSIPIAQQISRIYEKKLESYFFPGDSDHGQAFVHLADLISCLQRVVDLRSELKNEIFLIAEPDVMSYAELQDQIGELLHHKEWPTIRIPKVMAKAGAWAQEKMGGDEKTFIKPWMVGLADAHYPVAIGHARERLGWEPKHTLRETLPEMIGRLKQDPRRWYEMNGLSWPEDEEKQNEDSKASSKASS
ncbi:MAG TPA: NAD(P)-dependent oxidoreductase [Pyrinomonadaceae bacterium]|nr:NAD(P)-dependent oxidoreductase [Pyrinomonadaceae bacterium]